MTKQPKKLFRCTNCDAQFPAWQGRCTQCESWGTVVEQQASERTAHPTAAPVATVSLATVKSSSHPHVTTGIPEFDRVLSGGFVRGSLTLLGGSPGIGKSTLVLQVAAGMAAKGRVLYVSGEESPEQLKLRYDRLGLARTSIEALVETSVPAIVATVHAAHPVLAIIDSVQTVTVPDIQGEPGSITQIKAATVGLLEAAKQTGVPIILVGHVTKEGAVAGPKTLEHLVDTVLYLEGDENQSVRLLRAAKHRFGITDEIGVFTMTGKGLQTVKNPSELFLLEERTAASGSAITVVLEGSRPFLVEVQALVSATAFGYPRRLAAGIETARLELILAVLTKRAGLKLATQDVHVNLVGGLKVRETAVDLAVALAVASGLMDQPLPERLVAIGEIGLGGELRPVPRLDQRLKEAAKLGFREAVVPSMNIKAPPAMTVTKVRTVSEAISRLLPSS